MLYEVLARLSARLPELEWKLSRLNTVIHIKQLPPGLFRSRIECTAQTCIDEIKTDIYAIQQQNNEHSAHYLAERVGKKINVLVRFCQQTTCKKKTEQQPRFGVQAIGTRQQWLKTMQDNIDVLNAQHQALAATLAKVTTENNTQATLNLQLELGKAERRLTLAKETLTRSTV